MNQRLRKILLLDRRLSQSLTLQLYDILTASIKNHLLLAGEKLPTPSHLENLLAMDAKDILHTYQLLIRDKLISQDYVVLSQTNFKQISTFNSISNIMKSCGFDPVIKNLEIIKINDEVTLKALGFNSFNHVYHIKRTYQVKSKVLAYANIYVFDENIQADLKDNPYYDYLSKHHTITSKRYLNTHKMSESLKDMFNRWSSDVCFKITSKSFNEKGILIEYNEAFVHPDHQFSIKINK